MKIALRPEPQFEGVSDLELLHVLCTSIDDQAPYKEFVRRFLPEVKGKCKRKCELRKLDPHIGESIAHEVFERIRRYKTFKKERYKGTDEHRWILAYLTRSAGNLFIDHFYQTKRPEEDHETYFDDFREEARSIDPARLKDIKDISELIFKKMNIKEQTVVLADLEHKKHGKYLPDDVTLALSQRLGVRPASIRKIRERAKEKINQALHEINQA